MFGCVGCVGVRDTTELMLSGKEEEEEGEGEGEEMIGALFYFVTVSEFVRKAVVYLPYVSPPNVIVTITLFGGWFGTAQSRSGDKPPTELLLQVV